MNDGLAGLQVVELGGGISAAMATRLLADLGATVVKVEPPEGDPTRRRAPFLARQPEAAAEGETSGTFLYLNTNKRGITLELPGGGNAELERLISHADLLVHNFSPPEMEAKGISFARFEALNPHLCMLSITPFGLTGPYRNYAANELTLIHGGGWGWIIPGKGTPAELPPIKPFGQHVLIQAGLHGAVAALGACRGALQSGRGVHIDQSVQETVLFILGRHFSLSSYTEQVESRRDPSLYEPMNIYPCRDGFVFLICPEQNQWERLVKVIGSPSWATGAEFASRKKRGENAAELYARLSEWTRTWQSESLFHACQGERAGAAPIMDYLRLQAEPHLHDRGFFVDIQHPRAGSITLPGAPYRLKKPWWALRRPAPLLGEATPGTLLTSGPSPRCKKTGSGKNGADHAPPPDLASPLRGVRVLDLSWVWAGPHCTMMMGFLGAEVLKVESSQRLDLPRRAGPFPPEMNPGPNRSGYFNQVNQCKKSIGIHLGQPEGVALVKELASHCDVMISNFGTGVLEKLDLAPETMLAIQPELTIATISAFGQSGPYRRYMGYGPLISPLAGLSAQTGYAEDGRPRDLSVAYGDPNGGVYCAVGIMAALWAQLRHGGGGQVLDLSMWEAMLNTAFEGWMNHALGHPPHTPMGNHDPVDAPHNVYRCRGEDEWVALAATNETQWQGLCRAMEAPQLAQDARFEHAEQRKIHESALDQLIGEWCAGKEKREITRRMQAEGVPAFPVLSSKALQEDPHLAERKCFTHLPHPEVGVRTLVGAPWRLGRKPAASPAPLLGADTDEVLQTLLGLSAAERERLKATGVIESA